MFRCITERQIGWGDLDATAIIHYPHCYEWIDTANHHLFDAIGLNHQMLLRSRKLQFTLVESGCTFFKSGRYLARVQILWEIQDVGKKTITFKYRIVAAEDGGVLAEAMEKRICIDASNPDHLKAKDIPEDILAVLREKMAS